MGTLGVLRYITDRLGTDEFATLVLPESFATLPPHPPWVNLLTPFHSARKVTPRVVTSSLRSMMVGKKLYVGNLTYGVTNVELEELFSQFGTVQSAQVITDRDTGRSKGFGFVEMDTDAEAQEAIRGLHDQDHKGRRLTVNEARPREARPDRGGYGGGGYDDGGRGGYGNGGRGDYGNRY